MSEIDTTQVPSALLAEAIQAASLARSYAITFAPAFAPTSKAGEAMRAVDGLAATLEKLSAFLTTKQES